MKRSILKVYDNINDSWTIHYFRKYTDCMRITTFKTPTFTKRYQQQMNVRGLVMPGIKKQVNDQWLGYSFIRDLVNELPVCEREFCGIEIKD